MKKSITGALKSKTMWFNLITGILAVANALGGQVIPTEVAALIVAAGNIILRMITTTPLSQK